MMLQLNPGIYLKTPKGDGIAHFVRDYGMEHDLIWVVGLDKNGEIWNLSNREIRLQKNITFGRRVGA